MSVKRKILIDNNYKNTYEISIDYAILKKDDKIYVITSDSVKDKQENICLGRTSYIDGANNMVISSGKEIIIDGLSHMLLRVMIK